MGLGKWLMTKGFGSPGHTSEAICNSFNEWKTKNSNIPDEIFSKYLIKLCAPNLPESATDYIIKRAEGRLSIVILGIVMNDFRNKKEALRGTMENTFEIIYETIKGKTNIKQNVY